MDLPFYLLLNHYVSGKRHSLLQRDGKILMRDSIYAFTSDSGGSRAAPPPRLASCFKLRPEGLEKSVPESVPPPPPPSYPRYPFSLILRDSIDSIDNYQLSFGRVPLIYKLYIYKVYLLLTDAKLLMRDSIYMLYINIVYLLRRDTKLILRDSIYN